MERDEETVWDAWVPVMPSCLFSEEALGVFTYSLIQEQEALPGSGYEPQIAGSWDCT